VINTTILLLIGQIGAGKSEVGGRIAALTGAQFVRIDDLRAQGIDTSASSVANAIAAAASLGVVIFECTGAASDFEELVIEIERAGHHAFVVLLQCLLETAAARVRQRANWVAPTHGGSWAPQLRWTETQLRLVPADMCLETDTLPPEEAARLIADAWDSAQADRSADESWPTGVFSFSQLAAFDVCPQAYRYKYIERRPEVIESAVMFLGKRVHEALFHLYSQGATRAVPERELLTFLASRITETLPADTPSAQAEDLVERGTSLLRFHYSQVHRHDTAVTLALEKRFSLQLSPELSFVGVIDRIAVAPSGVYEVIDYKISARKKTSRPRIPDLLQVAAYGAAALLEYQPPALRACRHLLPTGEREEIALGAADLPRLRSALRRWIKLCWRNSQREPRPGQHCASCQFNPICPAASVPAIAGALRVAA
jgi:putative RecB family exonuclease